MRNINLGWLLAILFVSGSAQAVPVIGSASGLAAPAAIFDFTTPPPTLGPNQTGGTANNVNGVFNLGTYSGLTFGGGAFFRYNPNASFFFNAAPVGFAGDYIGSYISAVPNVAGTNGAAPVEIAFATSVNSALIAIETTNDSFLASTYTMEAFRGGTGGTLVDSFTFTAPNGGFFGFQNVAGGLDTLRITAAGVSLTRYDNLQFDFAPELDPRSSGVALAFAFFALGLLHRRQRQFSAV